MTVKVGEPHATPATPRTMGDTDAPHLSPVTPAEDARTLLINKVNWGAVFAGVAASLAAQLVLNMIGLGIGASTIDPLTNDATPAASSLSLGAAAWYGIAGIVAAYLGGLVAGRLSGVPKESTAGWHGLTAWAVSTLVIAYLLTSAVGGLLGGAFNAVTSAAGGMGRAATTAAQTVAPSLANANDPFGAIERQVRDASGGNDPAALRDAATSALRAAVTGDAAQARDANERAAQALARAQNISVEDARTRVAGYVKQYNDTAAQVKQRATEAADATAKGVSRGALFGALGLLLGALASWFGGRSGAVDPTMTMARAATTTATTVRRT